MRVRKNPPTRLVGVLFILIGLIMLYVLGQQTVLSCERLESDRVDCRRAFRWMALVPVGEKALGNVTTAWVDRRCDEDGCTYAIRLNTDQGEVGLVSYYSSGQTSKERTVARLNAFLRDATMPAVVVRSGPGFVGIVAALAFVGAGVAAVMTARQKGKPLTQAASQAMTNSLDTSLGPVAWRADAAGLDISYQDEAVRILWPDVSRAAMIQMTSANMPAPETLARIPGVGSMLAMVRGMGEEYRVLVLARGKAQARAFRCPLPILDPAAAVLVEDIRRNIGDRWLGELAFEEQGRVFAV